MNKQPARIDAWKKIERDGQQLRTYADSLEDADVYEVRFIGRKTAFNPPHPIDCGDNLRLAQSIVAALECAYERGGDDKMADLRTFIGA